MTQVLNYLRWLIANIIYVFITVAIAAGIGFGAGWVVKGKFFASQQAVEQKQELKQDAAAVNQAHKDGAAVDAKKDKITADTTQAQRNLSHAPILKKPAPVQPSPATAPTTTAQETKPNAPEKDCPPTLDVLSVYGVGVLNHALDPTYPDPAGWDPATKQTPSDAGLREVSDLAAQIGGLYGKLGADYDAVMQTVEQYQKDLEKSR
jgi:hypothetical protein